MNPLLSIVMINYNKGKYLENNLKSIYNNETDLLFLSNQVELIIVDDCSTDNSLAVIKKFVDDNKAKNIRLLKNKYNYHMLRSRLNGIQESRGEFIWNIDSDDAISNLNKVVRLVNENKDYDVLFFNSEGITSLVKYLLINQHFVWNYIIRKECIKKTIDIPSIDDYQFFNNIVINENRFRIKYLKGSFYDYRINTDSETLSFPNEYYIRDDCAHAYYMKDEKVKKFYYEFFPQYKDITKDVKEVFVYVNRIPKDHKELLKIINFNINYVYPNLWSLHIFIQYVLKERVSKIRYIYNKDLKPEKPKNISLDVINMIKSLDETGSLYSKLLEVIDNDDL